MEVDSDAVLRLLSALRGCSRYIEHGVAGHPLDELDVGLLSLAEQGRGTLRPSQAAAELEVAFPTVTRHVRGLQEAGRVAIEPDCGDRRGYRIVITAAGSAMLTDFRAGLLARVAPVFRGWDAAEVTALADGLTRLEEAMGVAREQRAAGTGATTWWRERAGISAEEGSGR
jgi:DNA-binding MarR family transcriptional regulator